MMGKNIRPFRPHPVFSIVRIFKAKILVDSGMTLRDVGEEMGVSLERVRQMKHQANRYLSGLDLYNEKQKPNFGKAPDIHIKVIGRSAQESKKAIERRTRAVAP